jgi:hypothetical protein
MGELGRWRQLFSWRALLAATLLLALSALVGDAAYGLSEVKGHLDEVRRHLSAIQEGFSSGDLDFVIEEAKAAEAEASAASGAARRPSLVLAKFVGGLDRDADALAGLVEVARLTTKAATAGIQAATDLDLDDQGNPRGLFVDGRVELETLAAAREDVHVSERQLYAATILLEGLRPRLSQLRVPLEAVHAEVRAAFDRVTRVRTYLDLVPSLLGKKGPRSYLLAFQALPEARATGGLMGFLGVLETRDGSMSLTDVRPLGEIQTKELKPVAAPDWFRDSYNVQAALSQFQQANVSPNYPVVSEVLLNMYEQATGKRLDGVLTMDPIALRSLMAATGDLHTNFPPMDVSAEEVPELIFHTSYVDLSVEEQDVFLADLLNTFWERIAKGDVDARALAEGLGEALRTQHLKLFSEGKDQLEIESLGLAGRYDVNGPMTQMVFNNNYGVNKVDYFLHRKMDVDVKLNADRSALVTTTIELENQAPAGSPSAFLGPGELNAPGTNVMTLNVLMPPRAETRSLQVDGKDHVTFQYLDDRSPVAWDVVTIPPGKRRTVTLRYSVPDAVAFFEQGTVFDFALYPQSTVNPDAFSIHVDPPTGSSVTDATAGEIRSDGSVFLSGDLLEPFAIRIRMSSP